MPKEQESLCHGWCREPGRSCIVAGQITNQLETSTPKALSKTSAGVTSEDEVHRTVARWVRDGALIYGCQKPEQIKEAVQAGYPKDIHPVVKEALASLPK